MRLTRLRAMIGKQLELFRCRQRQHGPFIIYTLSTADSSPAPALWCEKCHTNCAHLFVILKYREIGCVLITNQRTRPAAIFGAIDDIAIMPGETTVYSLGKFSAPSDHFAERSTHATPADSTGTPAAPPTDPR